MRRLTKSFVTICALSILAVLAYVMGPPTHSRTAARGQGANSPGTISVPPGGNLQSALDRAEPGDTIVLQSGVTYGGHFTLPNKPDSKYITVRTSALDSLPPEGSRVSPADGQYMPKLVSPDKESVITATQGAHHFRFIGIEFRPPTGVYMYDVIRVGLGTETSLQDLPHDFVFDRDYIHGDPAAGTKRGLFLNGGSVTIENCYISDFKGVGQDTQAVSGSNGSGSFHIINNYLEASGENIIFGGSPTFVKDMVPTDIEIRHNYFYKPLSWRAAEPSYAGTPWSVKNLLELKKGRRVLIDGNIFENNWPQAQNGFAILFTIRTDNGETPWTVVEDVRFTHNIVRHSASGFNISGRDDNGQGRTRNILIRDNLLEDISQQHWGADGKMFQLLQGTDGVTVDHNTLIGDGLGVLALAGNLPHTNFVFRNNVTMLGRWGVWTQKGMALAGLTALAPGSIFTKNVFVRDPRAGNGSGPPYPPNNFFVQSWDAVRFVDLARGDYQLAPNSPYRKAGTDGKDLGADIGAVLQATAGVEASH
jgi:hypothetical protein